MGLVNSQRSLNTVDGNAPGLEVVLSTDSARGLSVDTEEGSEPTINSPNSGLSGNTDSSSQGQKITQRILKPIQDTLTPLANAAATAADTTLGYIVPKIEKIHWRDFVILSLVVATPAAAYIVGFTKLGWGLSSFYFLSRYFEQHAYILALSLAGFATVLFLCDCHHWKSKFGQGVRYFAISILILGCAAYVLFISSTFPYGPISMYMILSPMWLVLAKRVCYKDLPMRTYVPWLSGPLFFNAIVILGLWLYWTLSTDAHEWTDLTRLADAHVSGCQPDYETYPGCEVPNGGFDDNLCFYIDPKNPQPPLFNESCPPICVRVFDKCANMFIVWSGPFLVSLGLFFLSFFATFLKATGTIEQEVIKFGKLWFFLLFVMWIAASLAGAGAGVSVTLAALTLSAFIASAILLASSFNHIERGERFNQVLSSLLEKYRAYLNIAKGLVVVTSSPIFIVYLALSFVNQTIRNFKCPCTRNVKTTTESLRDVMGAGHLTVEARRLIREIKSWDMVDVLTYANYWGMGFIVFAVLAPKFTTLFLSWIIEKALDMSIPVVTGILLGIGVVMFLLPPVPGAPIYLTFGIVIVPVGREVLGLTYSIVYAMGVSLLLKLFATFLQQKMIGGLLQNSTGVRKMVGINTGLMRAFKLVLAEPGFSSAKICILCGGPDWPTSVLCGIMGLPLAPILVGTLPVVALIVPTVLAGSFTYMSSLTLPDGTPEFAWAGTAKAVSMAVAALVLFGFMLFAAYYVEVTMREREDEVAQIPIDEEVKKLDDESELSNEAYKEVTQWHLVPSFAKFILILSVVSMIGSCYVVQLFQEDAFISYQLTDTIDGRLNGDWLNLILPLGYAALAAFAASIFFFWIFLCWAKRKAKMRYEEKKNPTTEDNNGAAVTSNSMPSNSRLSHVDNEIGISVYAHGSM